jgi:hypothetical protein
MFERYTEKARRVIFFARYEASQFGSPQIEAEYILLGLMREDKALSMRFVRPRTTPGSSSPGDLTTWHPGREDPHLCRPSTL